jgi:hypothetical protein
MDMFFAEVDAADAVPLRRRLHFNAAMLEASVLPAADTLSEKRDLDEMLGPSASCDVWSCANGGHGTEFINLGSSILLIVTKSRFT